MNSENYILPFLWMRDQDEATLREEIDKIDACGIKAICLESRPHPDFCGNGWWRDFDIVISEAKKRNMKIWLLDDSHFPTGQANGMIPAKHPDLARKYIMMQHTDCVGPIVSANLDVNLFMTKAFTWLDFGKKINKPLINETKLLSVVAYPLVENDIIGNDGIDLTDFVQENGWLCWNVPCGVWRICVSFETYDFGARNEYINYIDEKSVRVLIDAIYEVHYSRYKNDFGKTIAGFFSDEPGFYNVDDFLMQDGIGRKKMALPWSDEMRLCMEKNAPSNWKHTLAYLWFQAENHSLSAFARKNYMNQVSRLYEKNFSKQIGAWCENHDVEYIGHVIEDNNEHTRLGCGTGHYFRAMAGQHMAGIDVIGSQIIPGNPYGNRHGVANVIDGQFNHFGLVKLGASAAHIDPKMKGRLMCEAFGAYGWNFGVKNIKWLVDYLLVQGVNHFVPHAFSMANYPDDDCPPHFYARGNNPQFWFFAQTMQYTNRMCNLLNGGKNVPIVAVVYPAEHDWMHDCMQVQTPGRVLQENQIDYEIVPIDAFVHTEQYNTAIENSCLSINGLSMQSLLIPQTKFLDENLAKFIISSAEKGLDVVFINSMPQTVVDDNDNLIQQVTTCSRVISLEDLAVTLKSEGKFDIALNQTAKDLVFYHYRTNEDVYFLFNSSLSQTIVREITIKTVETLVVYEAWQNERKTILQQCNNGLTKIAIELKPYESIVLTTNRENNAVKNSISLTQPISSIDISENWLFNKARAIDYPNMSKAVEMQTLCPVSNTNFEFSGIMRYEKEVEITEIPNTVLLCAEHIYEVAEVFVNNISVGMKVAPPYNFDITKHVCKGKNKIVVEVANTPTRDTLKTPGIFGSLREILEPSGMFGEIVLQLF